jgi:hypothetical protein
MGLFGKTRFLDPPVEDWCLETWGWLMANLGGMERLRQIPLVTPTPEFFPPTALQGHERALYVFDRVKALMAMADWPCELTPFYRQLSSQRVGVFSKLTMRASAPGGTFSLEGGKPTISYATDLVERPEELIAALVHELAQYLVSSVHRPIPGGIEFRELAGDLAIAFSGFGLFGLNGAFKPQTSANPFAQGAGVSLPEPAWAFAVALFAHLKGIEVPTARLSRANTDAVGKAGAYLKTNDDLLAPLRAIA